MHFYLTFELFINVEFDLSNKKDTLQVRKIIVTMNAHWLFPRNKQWPRIAEDLFTIIFTLTLDLLFEALGLLYIIIYHLK